MILIALGDTHIPDRAKTISPHILNEVKKADAVLFTGDATEYATLFLLEKLAPVYAVRGNMDTINLPWERKLEFEGKRILLMHGHKFGRGNYRALVEYARGFDLLICGHTHRQEHFHEGNTIVVNPGTATGAWSSMGRKEATFTKIIINRDVRVEEYRVDENGIQSKGSSSEDEVQAPEKGQR